MYGRTALHFACQKPILTKNDNPNDKHVIDINFEYDCIILLLLSIEDIDITLETSEKKTPYELYKQKNKYIYDEILKAFEDASNNNINTNDKKHYPALPDSDLTVGTKNFSFIKNYLDNIGVGYLYNEEIKVFENECSGKKPEETMLYVILENFVQICNSFDFQIELNYYEDIKLLRLSCFWNENVIKYSLNEKDCIAHSPKIVYEEQVYCGTSCAIMYIYKFTPPPAFGWGWKIDSQQIIVKNKETFKEAFTNLLLKIT